MTGPVPILLSDGLWHLRVQVYDTMTGETWTQVVGAFPTRKAAEQAAETANAEEPDG